MNKHVYINDIKSFLPNKSVSNEQMEVILGQVGSRPSRSRKMILRSNKIIKRYYAIDQKTGKITHSNAQLTAVAIRKLNNDNFDINNIDLLACGTSIPDQLLPNHTSMVHGELAIPSCETIATSGICLSGIMSLKYAYMSVLSGLTNNAVATGSENASAMMRAKNFQNEISKKVDDLQHQPELAFEKDFLRWMLSDGAGAALMTDQPNKQGISLKVDWIKQKSYANEQKACMYAGAEKQQDGRLKSWLEHSQEECLNLSIFSIKQDVKLLNEHIINYTVTKPLKELVEQGDIVADEIDFFIPHYSSGYFRDKVYAGMVEAGCDIPQSKWFTNLATNGNTGSASIYIMLAELFHSGDLQVGDKLLCYIPESGRFSTAFMKFTVV